MLNATAPGGKIESGAKEEEGVLQGLGQEEAFPRTHVLHGEQALEHVGAAASSSIGPPADATTNLAPEGSHPRPWYAGRYHTRP